MENSPILPNIRIRKITLTDFRNIVHADVDIPGGKMSDFKNQEGSILGLYGQNGSGKTSVILAITALKYALCGRPFLFPIFASCVRAGCESARVEYELSALNEKGLELDIYYSFSIGMEDIEPDHTSIDAELMSAGIIPLLTEKGKKSFSEWLMPSGKKIRIFDEVLQFAALTSEGEKTNKQILIDTTKDASNTTGKAFGNKTKYDQLTANSGSDIDEILRNEKIKANVRSTSFIFSRSVINRLIEGSSKLSFKILLRALAEYGENYLFVSSTDDTGMINQSKGLPMAVWHNDINGAVGGKIYLDSTSHNSIEEEAYDLVSESVKSISRIISAIIPGLQIEIKEISNNVLENGKPGKLYDIVSIRNGVTIPIAYESDGIRRIMSILMFMVGAYNNPSVTVAIDEIDSGIFEYMLGEILSIMKESAKGQLIFTSHNLRPLEVLPYKNLLFTTVNPANRFAKLEGISGNNNLRDSYFRSIILGSGKNAFYDSTDSFNIEQAMFEVAHPRRADQ